jgi:2-phospho-L-lactate guanylyltransferase
MEVVQSLSKAAKDPPVIVLVPDRHGEGTNALLVRPSGLIEYDFGPNSFQRHQLQAEQLGARVEIRTIPSLGLDLDLPEDLEHLRERIDLEMIIPMKERD